MNEWMNFIEIGHLVLKLWSKKQFQMKNLGFRSDNPGKKVGTVCPIWFKKSAPFPQCNVDPSHVARGHVRSANIDWWGVGKDMTNGELGGFFKTIHCPKCPYNRKHLDNCNKVGQVSQLFFSRIVGLQSYFRYALLSNQWALFASMKKKLVSVFFIYYSF